MSNRKNGKHIDIVRPSSRAGSSASDAKDPKYFPSQIWPTQRGNETNHLSKKIPTPPSLSINVAVEATQPY